MKKGIMIFILALFSRAIAQESWFCTDDQAIRQGNIMMICGVGTYSTEGETRKRALINAMEEFQIMCSASADCKGHRFTVEPKRSSCSKNTGIGHSSFENFTCYRMLVFTIQ